MILFPVVGKNESVEMTKNRHKYRVIEDGATDHVRRLQSMFVTA